MALESKDLLDETDWQLLTENLLRTQKNLLPFVYQMKRATRNMVSCHVIEVKMTHFYFALFCLLDDRLSSKLHY
jgi:hypothetical protein